MNFSSIEVEQIEPVIYPRDSHCISRKNIDPDALKIMRRLLRHGYRAHLVGGGVRDLLLSKEPKDFDIATDATPNKIKSLFRNCRIIGRRFKLAHIYFKNNKIIEVSTFRDVSDPVDIEDARENENMVITRDNQYGDERTDALRRDITINGLFYDLSSFSIIDYVGGMEDLSSQTIRVIGEPMLRFAEDPVRMLRVIRHAARAGFKIEPGCLKSLHEAHELLPKCSPMRVFEELKKDLLSGYSADILSLLAEHTLLHHLIPELLDGERLLFDQTHDFFKSLIRSDELAREGKLDSITPVLALMTLYGAALRRDLPPQNKEALLSLCQDDEVLAEVLNEAFSVLAVPRKEKERIFLTLRLWGDIERALEKEKGINLHHRRNLTSLYQLLKMLPSEIVSEEVLELVETSIRERNEKGIRPDKPAPRNRSRKKNSYKKQHTGQRNNRRGRGRGKGIKL